MRTEAPLLAPIFRSDGQARLLAAILMTDEELSITDLAEHAGPAYPTAHGEVARLIDAGILAERAVGRTRLVTANGGSPITSPLREILAFTAGPVPALRRALEPIEGVESAFIYGSFAARPRGVPGPAPQDVDLMVVGTPSAARILDACAAVENQVGRPVNPTIMSPHELAEHSGFLDTLRADPVVPIIGETPWS